MGPRTSRRSIFISVILGIAVIGGTYLVTFAHQGASATGTDDVLKSLASQDSNGDGMPDWIEILYGLDPKNAHSYSPDVTNAEAIRKGLVSLKAPAAPSQTDTSASSTVDDGLPQAAAGSFTDQFARDFFVKYMSINGGNPPSDADKNKLVTDFIAAFKENAAQFFTSRFTATSLIVSNDVSASEYADSVEKTMANRQGTGLGDVNPVTLVSDAVQNNDADARNKLAILGNFYAGIASDLAKVSAPQELSDAHTKLVQSLDLIGLAQAAIAHINDDPMVAMAAIGVLESAPQDTHKALEMIVEGVTKEKGTPDSSDKPGFILRGMITPH